MDTSKESEESKSVSLYQFFEKIMWLIFCQNIVFIDVKKGPPRKKRPYRNIFA
jgi:hypothetical protein